MADLENALLLRMEASLAKFEKQMATAQARANGTSVEIEKRFDRMGNRVAVSAAKGSAGIARMAQMSGRSRFVLQNTANQLGDIAVQMQGGTSAARVFGQQMPQLLGGFGALGGMLGVVAPLLGTVAAIGIPVGAALFAMGRDAETASVMLEKIDALDLQGARSAISNLTELQNRYTEALQVAAATRSSTAIAAVQDIAREYEAEKALMELRLVEMENRLRAIQALKAAKQDELKAILDTARAEAEIGLAELGTGALNEMELKNKAIAEAVLAALDAQAQLTGEIKQASAEAALLELGTEAVRAKLSEAGVASEEMNTHVKDGQISAEGLAAASASISFASATGEAQALAAALGVALDTASRLANTSVQQAMGNNTPGANMYRGGGPNDPAAYSLGTDNPLGYTDTWSITPPATGGGGGGGGGGGSSVDQAAQAFERLRGQLDPTYAAMQKLSDAQETLNWALESGKISLPEYQALLAQANQEFTTGAQDVADYVQELGNFMGSFLTDMYQGLRNGEGAWGAFKGAALNALDSIANAALKMAGNAIVQMLFGGMGGGGGIGGGLFGLGGGGGLFSFDGGGYTGGGARTGGVDGRGGFPAILHPNESVVDHTKGGGGADVTINISGNLPKGTVRREGNRIDIDLSQAISSVLGSGGADGAMRSRYGVQPRGM